VQFLGGRDSGGGEGERQFVPAGAASDDFTPTGTDDDIPF
jgi:hypothetical protein